MRIVQSDSGNPTLAVVCCVHGDERFGLDVFDFLLKRKKRYPGLLLMIANEPAVARDVRFIEQDLNRSFPGSRNGTGEARLAAEMLDVLKNVPLVLDIHTTHSELTMVPIVTKLDEATRSVVRLLPSREVVLMEPPLANKSLIGNVRAGVSLEYNRAYAAYPGVLHELAAVVARLMNGAPEPAKTHEVYHVTGVISKEVSIPEDARNFQLIRQLNSYPVLLNEPAYPTLHALAATRKETVLV